ncbi:MAG: LCP family protein [Oscillospiraceae bacterium]|nr:LCP family protein [Oscillospiraceae bacterium]
MQHPPQPQRPAQRRKLPPRQLEWQGETYTARPDLESYLLIGVDEMGEAVGTESYIGGGQGDVQMLLVLDNANQTWQALQLNRDSMVEMPVLGVNGSVIGTDTAQLALAHSYGNGREESCENNVTTVSRLLEDQPIDGYFAVNMDAVNILTDLAGGITVTLNSDLTACNPAWTEGAVVTLTDENALDFVRSRKGVEDETNLSHMVRQRQYLTALRDELTGRDTAFAAEVYSALADYTVTNIGSGTAQQIAAKLNQYQEQPLLTIEGESKVVDGYWAYYLDEASLRETIITLFYEKD